MTYLKMNLFAAVLLATSTMAVSAQPHTSAVSASAAASSSIDKTRAEVRADLALWKKAGLDQFRVDYEPSITFSREYRSAYAEYVRMRNGPEYNAEVQRQSKR